MESDLKIALRDSKTATRPYVIVNPKLAKHLPAVPSQALEYFSRLGVKVAGCCRGERVLVIGFAETATAVGAAVAAHIDGALYVHTTRETISEAVFPAPTSTSLISEFLEEHSHARNQALYLREELADLSSYERIVFVEDEVTTGKTILNFLRSVDYKGKITVAALVFNGFDESAFAAYDASFFCLQKTGCVGYLEFGGLTNPRLGADAGAYFSECLTLASRIAGALNKVDIQDKNVLVLGTEEFMYPALVLGCELEKSAKSVKSHSTTRSPLLPRGSRDGEESPFFSRHNFPSVYDRARTAYLYNLEKYDTVIIMTDAPDPDREGLLRAVSGMGSQTVYFIKIRDAGAD